MRAKCGKLEGKRQTAERFWGLTDDKKMEQKPVNLTNEITVTVLKLSPADDSFPTYPTTHSGYENTGPDRLTD